MRKIIIVLLLISFLFAEFPYATVKSHNEQILKSVCPYEKAGTDEPDFYNPVTFAEIKPVGVFPSVNGYISSSESNALLWCWGAKYTDYVEKDIGNCGGDNKMLKNITSAAKIKYAFRNKTIEKELDGFLLKDIIPELGYEYADGRETLDIELIWRIEFRYLYTETKEKCSMSSQGVPTCYCIDETKIIVYYREGTEKLNHTVGDAKKVFFLSKPVLKEQWYKNNKFEVVVLSKFPVYYAEMKANETRGEAVLKGYRILGDEHGFWRIELTENGDSAGMNIQEGTHLNSPLPLEKENDSFYFVYLANMSYEALGKHNDSFKVVDIFNNEEEETYIVYSRMMTHYGNISEEGSEVEFNPEIHRPSSTYKTKSIAEIFVPPAIVGIIMLFAYLRIRS
ncbi:hypothetical protein JXB01_02320 [Candidatus Micrarchaeota archaeon]|nr:hypothetical protein [Candidatus Micrarchaeota archaeon]